MEREMNETELGQVSGGTGGEGRQNYTFYTVQRGDTLPRISYRFRTTVDAIISLNPIITNRNFLRAGWVLRLPDNR
ncbi:MAG: LysM domain-containing protein [Clostridiaceae bacterium]